MLAQIAPLPIAAPPSERDLAGLTVALVGVTILSLDSLMPLHVLVGILLEAWLLLRLVTGLTRYRLVGLQATAFYWHFVNVLAVIVVLTQVSPSL